MKINLKKLSLREIESFVEKDGYSPYRAKQLINWIYKKKATSFTEMTDLPKSYREFLEKNAFLSTLKLLKKLTSKDGTQKFLFELEDGETIESVLIPDKTRLTLCISTQVGCAMGCKFCITGELKLRRNLKAYEIIDQIISVNRLMAKHTKISNIVLMGMGEPLHNFTEVVEALWRTVNVIGFSKRRITLSTVGIVPKMRNLAQKAPRINLAVSLNATTDQVRNSIMPVNRKYPLQTLINACKQFPLEPRERITFEYVLISGINDSREDAIRLTKLLRGIRSKVNLIPYNAIIPVQHEIKTHSKSHGACLKQRDNLFKKPPDDVVIRFQEILSKAGITAIVRKSKGADICAACGQLRAGYSPNSFLTTFKSS